MTRLAHAWRTLGHEQRLAAMAAGGLFVSMLLPWYSQTDTVVVGNAARATRTSLSAFEAFSFVEAAVLLVSAGVLGMLFARAEGRAFQLPGGDGMIVTIAGGWAALLIFYRMLDKPGLQGTARITATVGVQWGIFIALLLALGLMYAGARMRSTERPQPPLARTRPRRPPPDPHEEGPRNQLAPEEPITRPAPAPARARPSTPAAADRRAAGRRPRYPPAPADQLSFDDSPPDSDRVG